MSKILKVILKDFRVFNGENCFDFQNPHHEPYNFVCIYGQNGLGKSSFFDGIEWYTTGRIDRIDNILRNQGISLNESILKNRYSNASVGSVGVIFSDGNSCTRTTGRGRNGSIADYYSGKLNPVNKSRIHKGCILANNKISSFISSTKPTERYTSWGGFLGENANQQEILNSVFLVKRKLEIMSGKSQQELLKLKTQIGELDINNDTKVEINQFIDEYNGLGNDKTKQITLINRDLNGKLTLPNITQLKDIRSSNGESVKKLESKIDDLKTLINQYGEFHAVSSQYEIEIKNQQYYDELIKQCKGKQQLQRDNLKLSQQIKMIRKKLIEDFQLVIGIYENLTKTNSEAKRKLIADKEGVLGEIGDLVTTHNKLKENRVLLDTQLVNVKNNNKKIDAEIQQLAKYLIDPSSTISHQLNNLAVIFKDDDEQLSQIYHNLVRSEISIKTKNQEQLKLKEQYDNTKINFNEMSIAITTIMENIKKDKVSKCPVCKTVFENTETLLAKLDMSAQQVQVDCAYKIYMDSLNELQDLIKQQKSEINKWNEKCEKIRKIKLEKYTSDENIDKLEQNIVAIDSEINLVNTKKQSLILLLNKSHVFNSELTCESFLKWWNSSIAEVEIKINSACKYVEKIKNIRDKTLSDGANLSLIASEIVEFHSNQAQIHEDILIFIDFQEKIIKNNLDLAKLQSIDESKHDEYLKLKSNSSLYITTNKETIDGFKKLYNTTIDCEPISLEKINKIFETTEKIYKSNVRQNELLDKILNRISISEYDLKFDNLLREIKKTEPKFRRYAEGVKQFQVMYDKMKAEVEKNIDKMFGSDFMNMIYKRIEPYKDFGELKYEIKFNDDDKPELYVKGKNTQNNEDIIPELFYSTAQLNTVALSVFLGNAISKVDSEVKTIFIDDPISNFDDINSLAFVDLIRTIVERGEWQIIISTHDESLFRLFQNKISSEYYNSHFIKFTARGVIG